MTKGCHTTSVRLDWGRLLGFDQATATADDLPSIRQARVGTKDPDSVPHLLGAKIGPKEARGFGTLGAKVGYKPMAIAENSNNKP